MDNDVLNYCVSLRENGLDSDAIENDLEKKGLNASEIKELIKESDLIFLNNFFLKPKNNTRKVNYLVKMAALLVSLLLLIAAFIGHVKIGLSLLLIMWGGISLLKYKSKEGKYFTKSKYRN